MKKTATKLSGILTLIAAIFLFLVSMLIVGAQFEVTFIIDLTNSIPYLSIIEGYLSFLLLVLPCTLIGSFLTSVNLETIEIVVLSLLILFSAFMIFCGIKEILISHRDDVDFAHCKKTCWFMFFTKFMFFSYLIFAIIANFTIDVVRLSVLVIDLFIYLGLGIQNGFLILSSAIAFIALVLFLLPVINVAVVAKKVNKDGVDNRMAGQEFQNSVDGVSQGSQGGQPYQATPQPTMQANMPPIPNYNPGTAYQQNQSVAQNGVNNTTANIQQQSVNAQPQPVVSNQPTNVQTNNSQVVNAQMGNTQVSNVQPVNAQVVNQNNIPNAGPSNVNPNAQPPVDPAIANLSEKGKADLERLERLKNMGAVTPENYEAMKRKILQGN